MDSLKGILTVIAVGVPALLILLGFAAAVFGWMFGLVANDTGMRNFGILNNCWYSSLHTRNRTTLLQPAEFRIRLRLLNNNF